MMAAAITMTKKEFLDDLPSRLAHECGSDETCPACGKVITEAREGSPCSPKVHELAEKAGVTYTAVVQWLQQRKAPSAAIWERLVISAPKGGK